MYGGLSFEGDLDDLWILDLLGDGGTWQSVQLVEPRPPAGSGQQMLIAQESLKLIFGAKHSIRMHTPTETQEVWIASLDRPNFWQRAINEGVVPRLDEVFVATTHLIANSRGEWSYAIEERCEPK